MKILALDLGKYKTVACEYEAESGQHRFHTILTTPVALQQLVLRVGPDQVVLEICNLAGWLCDLLRSLGVIVLVANTNDDAWRWRKVRRKNDRCDALKLAQLAAVKQLREVYIPKVSIRQWRTLIAFRQQLVRRRNKVKNHIRDLLVSEGQLLPRGAKCWTQLGRAHLEGLARPLEAVGLAELWRGQLEIELRQLQALQEEIEKVEEKLHAIAGADARVAAVAHRARGGAALSRSHRRLSGSTRTLSRCRASKRLRRHGAEGTGLWGNAPAWPDYQTGQSGGALLVGGSSVGGFALQRLGAHHL